MDKQITFKVHDNQGEMKDPRWVECETENTQCPKCRKMMTVIMGANPGQAHFLYAHCTHCGTYFIAE